MSELSVAEIIQKFTSGELTSQGLVEIYLARIAAIDQDGPGLERDYRNQSRMPSPSPLSWMQNACGYSSRAAPRCAHCAQRQYRHRRSHDHHRRFAGLEGSIAPQDAFLVETLRLPGAILLAKANLSEWANFRSTHSSSGWSSRGGQTHNPYSLDRSPVRLQLWICGGRCRGSVRRRRWHRDRWLDYLPRIRQRYCRHQAHAWLDQPLRRSSQLPTARILPARWRAAWRMPPSCWALFGIDPLDPATRESESHSIPDYTQFLAEDGLQNARIGVARNFFGSDAGR